jgi:hypothetical protein
MQSATVRANERCRPAASDIAAQWFEIYWCPDPRTTCTPRIAPTQKEPERWYPRSSTLFRKYRRVGVVPGGVYEGERLSGAVLEGGSDWQNIRSDGSTTLDVRLVLKTTDDALIAMTYRGIRQGPHEAISRLEKGEVIDPESYYFRIEPLFEAAAAQYAWLNNLVAIGIGHRYAEGPRL